MGSFGRLIQAPGAHVPEDKRSELAERMQTLFRVGGLMQGATVQMCGKQIGLLRQPTIDAEGHMNCWYSYYEQSSWEDAGFISDDKRRYWGQTENGPTYRVYSGKFGSGEFRRAVLAAYQLENIYEGGNGALDVDGFSWSPDAYVAWIDYLFDEEYPACVPNPAFVFRIEEGYSYPLSVLSSMWALHMITLQGVLLIFEYRVLDAGIDEALTELPEYSNELFGGEKVMLGWVIECMEDAKQALHAFHVASELSEEAGLSDVLAQLCIWWQEPNEESDPGNPLCALDKLARAGLTPICVVALIAQEYGEKAEKLWGQVGAQAYWAPLRTEDPGILLKPISTAQFFGLENDDLILLWGEDPSVQFSPELAQWLACLRTQFDELLSEDVHQDQPLSWIMGMLSEAQESRRAVYCFAGFFEETLVHLSDERYLAVWKIFERMLRDLDVQTTHGAAGESSDARTQSAQNALITARTSMVRYLAVLENRKLREEVFGF